jgi:hypothetical protein
MYNRASADPDGRPWSERKKLMRWEEEKRRWMGDDQPDFDPEKPPHYRPPSPRWSRCSCSWVAEMHTDARAQHNGAGAGRFSKPSPYAAGPGTKPPAWHGLVAWDMLFNRLTTGLFLVAALGELMAPEAFTPVAKAAYPLALALLLADLVCLVLNLGDPLRFHHMLRVFKPTSPMSLGTWCLTVYALPLTVAAALSLLPAGGPALEWTRKVAMVFGLLPALGAAAYKGVLLSTNAQPGWRDARWLGGYLTNSALLLGCAEILALSVLMGQASATAVLRPALGLLLVLQ